MIFNNSWQSYFGIALFDAIAVPSFPFYGKCQRLSGTLGMGDNFLCIELLNNETDNIWIFLNHNNKI
jgi:hypothetical protein